MTAEFVCLRWTPGAPLAPANLRVKCRRTSNNIKQKHITQKISHCFRNSGSPHFIAAHDEIKPRFPSCRDSRSAPKSIGENKRRRPLAVFRFGCVVDGRKRMPRAVRSNSAKLWASSPALLRDYIGHETESSGPEKNRPPHAGTLQPVCGRILARDTRSRRQPEPRGTIAVHSE